MRISKELSFSDRLNLHIDPGNETVLSVPSLRLVLEVFEDGK